MKQFKVIIQTVLKQARYFDATSAEEAKEMFQKGNFDSEYDFEEEIIDEKIMDVKEVE